MAHTVLKLAPVIVSSLSAGLHELVKNNVSFIKILKDNPKEHIFVTIQFLWIALFQWLFYDNLLIAISVIPLAIMHHSMWRFIYIYENIRWALVAVCIIMTCVVW